MQPSYHAVLMREGYPNPCVDLPGSLGPPLLDYARGFSAVTQRGWMVLK